MTDSMTPPDPAREAAILARCEAATKGPWAVPVANVFRVVAPSADHCNRPSGLCPPYPWAIVANADTDSLSGFDAASNAAFIAHAREDVPWLLAQLTTLRARAERAEGDVIERIVVCVDTDALHEELDAWAGDRMAATRILRNHVTRALAARGE